jgi:hypothetical protein
VGDRLVEETQAIAQASRGRLADSARAPLPRTGCLRR